MEGVQGHLSGGFSKTLRGQCTDHLPWLCLDKMVVLLIKLHNRDHCDHKNVSEKNNFV